MLEPRVDLYTVAIPPPRDDDDDDVDDDDSNFDITINGNSDNSKIIIFVVIALKS